MTAFQRARWVRIACHVLPLQLVVLGGCYRYAPVAPDGIRAGEGVRARISANHAERIAPLLGRSDARLLVGRYLTTTADTLLVEVPTVVAAGTPTLHQRIAIPRDALLELERRTLDRKRTALAAGAAVAFAGSILVKNFIIDPGRERGPTEPGGNELRPRR